MDIFKFSETDIPYIVVVVVLLVYVLSVIGLHIWHKYLRSDNDLEVFDHCSRHTAREQYILDVVYGKPSSNLDLDNTNLVITFKTQNDRFDGKLGIRLSELYEDFSIGGNGLKSLKYRLYRTKPLPKNFKIHMTLLVVEPEGEDERRSQKEKTIDNALEIVIKRVEIHDLKTSTIHKVSIPANVKAMDPSFSSTAQQFQSSWKTLVKRVDRKKIVFYELTAFEMITFVYLAIVFNLFYSRYLSKRGKNTEINFLLTTVISSVLMFAFIALIQLVVYSAKRQRYQKYSKSVSFSLVILLCIALSLTTAIEINGKINEKQKIMNWLLSSAVGTVFTAILITIIYILRQFTDLKKQLDLMFNTSKTRASKV